MESPKTNEEQIPKTLDRYELFERIGAGGMGLIYKGVDTRLKRPVAIKIISDRVKDPAVRKNIRERLFNEARAAGGLSHPNLVQIYDCGEVNGLAYIVMEFIEGETLEDLLKAKGTLNLEELLRMGKELAAGLSFAHKKGIVHRDIKPSNIILEASSGLAKILDFGIAKFVDETEMKLTSTGMVLGSTHYLSPEHIIGKNLDGRSDVFCLGTLLYEASTGILPFRGSNSSTILYKIVHFDPQPPHEVRSDLHPAFSSVIMKCLRKAAADRYQKCEEIEKEIVEIQTSLLTERQTASGPQKSSHSVRLRSLVVRDSQLLSALQTHKKLSTQQVAQLKGKAAVETLLREDTLSEDDISKTIAECLNLPWIPRGRLKSVKIADTAFKVLPLDTIREQRFLPFFRDDKNKSLSVLIDGSSDFQKDTHIVDLMENFQLQFYVGGRQTIDRLIESKSKQFETGKVTGKITFVDTGEHIGPTDFADRRVLLIDNHIHNQEAVIKIFKRNENSLIVAHDVEQAMIKIKKEPFDHVWVFRPLVGDELEFETFVLKQNPGCEVRYYDHLAHELFEESITYKKFREFFNRIVHLNLADASPVHKAKALHFASLAVKIAQPLTETTRGLDEVYFSALFWKWERLTNGKGKFVDLFDGVFRFRYIFDCIGERYDGRGPMGLRENQIPLASRVVTALIPFETLHPNEEAPWTDEEVAELKQKYDQYTGKQLDPEITLGIINLLRPQAEPAKISKVVIVDSDPQFSSKLAAQLKQISADVTVYPDGVAALAGIKKEKPDLIVSEIMVSKLDGFALCARLRADAALKCVPLVFLSESSAPEHSTKAIQLGADDYIQKSSEPQFILAKLERMLKKAS